MRCVMRLVLRALVVVLLISSCLGQNFNIHTANKRQADPLLSDYIYGGQSIRPSNFRTSDSDLEQNEPGFLLSDDDFPPDGSVDKRVLSSFRERMEKEKEQNDYANWAEPYLRDYERERELGNVRIDDETNRNFERFLNELWEEYKASRNAYQYDTPNVYRTFSDTYRKRREPEYPSLGWSGVGYKKRANPYMPNEAYYRSMEEDSPQRYQVRRRAVLRRSYEIPDDLPYNTELYAKKKRNAVSKRSSNYYANHHKRFANKDQVHNKKYAKKEHPSGTDPKIMKDLKSLFDIKDGNKTEDEIKKKAILDKKSNIKKSDNTDQKVSVNKEQATVASSTESGHNDEKKDKEAKIDNKNKSDNEQLNIKKKSIDWSNYFGYDRRKKSRQSANNDIDEEWLMERYQNALSAAAAKRSTEYPLKYFKIHDDESARKKKQDDEVNEKKENPESETTNEAKLLEMDSKLKNIEDLIIDEALKYTGAHEGTTDSKEIQEIKDKVISRLAAAYSLEKMRKALGEFKNSIAVQRNAIQFDKESNDIQQDEKKRSDSEDGSEKQKDKKFHAAAEKKEDYHTGNELNFDDNQRSIMGNSMAGITELEVLDRRCRSVALSVSDQNDFFYPLCKGHQTCYVCSSEISSEALTNCDMLFLSKAYELCGGDPMCQWSARPALEYLRDAFEEQPIDRIAVCNQITEPYKLR